MINLLDLLKTHFNFPTTINQKLARLLNVNLSLSPEELAVHIYHLQRMIAENYGEEEYKDLLRMLSYLMRMYTQIEIYYTAEIGTGLKIVHGLGTVIGARVKLGENVEIYQNVTLGDKKDGTRGRPTIGNNVKIYAGSIVLGNIVIGDNCIIGANSLVMNSFPEGSIIVGTPAKKLN